VVHAGRILERGGGEEDAGHDGKKEQTRPPPA
jgi:hypothetical protein